MIDRFRNIATGAAELLHVEADMLLTAARRSLVWLTVLLAGGFVIGLGILGLLVALTWVIALEIGVLAAIAIVSAGLLALGLAACVAARRTLARASRRATMPQPLLNRRKEAHKLMAGQDTHPSDAPGRHQQESGQDHDLKDQIGHFIGKNPALAAAGAFTALALFGPARTFRLAGRAMMIGGIVAGAMRGAREQRPGERAPDADEPREPAGERPSSAPTPTSQAPPYQREAPHGDPLVSNNGPRRDWPADRVSRN